MKHLLSAGIIIFRKQATERLYLLLHYPHGHWDFVKGKIEPGESKKDAALRELKEETGLDATILDGFETSIAYIFQENQERVKKTVIFFVGEAQSDTIMLSDEHIDYAWLPYDEALKRLTFENARAVLEGAEQFLE